MRLCEARDHYVRWLSATKDMSPHTIRAYSSDIATFTRHLGDSGTVAQIDRDSMIAFMEAQRAAGLSARSLRRRASGLRGFCRWLVLHDLLTDDPWLGTTVAAGRPRKLPRIVATHDLDRLFRSLQRAAAVPAANDLHAPLQQPHESTTLLAVALMVATGLRVNELVTIDCDALDLHDGTVRLLGKGRRERHVFLTNGWLTTFTRAFIETRAGLGLAHRRLLFNRRLEPLTTAAMRARLLKAARDAGVAARVTPHMLRHTAATQLIEAGVDIRYIQRLLGHASLTTTEIYTHVSDRALRRVVSDADVLRSLLQQR